MKWHGFVVVMCVVLTLVPVTVAQERTLTVCMAETSQQAGLDYYQQVVIPAFEAQNPGVAVDFQICGWGVDNIVTRYIGGVAPDVYQIGGDNMGSYLHMIAPIDRFVQGWSPLEDFPRVMIDGLRVRGELYGIPFSMTTRSLTYRTDLFEEAGLSRDQTPATWEELVEYGRRLVRRDGNGSMTMQGFATDGHWLRFAAFIFQAGGNYMDQEHTRFTFGEGAGLEAAEFVRSLFWETQISDPTRSLGVEVHNGGTAMAYQSASILRNEQYGPLIDVAPPTRHVRQAQIIEPNVWVITNTSEMQQEAWNWIAFVSDLENMVNISRMTFTLPPRMGVLDYSPWADDPRFAQHYQNTAYSMTPPQQHPLMNRTRSDFIQPLLSQVFFQNQPISILEEGQRQANARLADMMAQ